MSFYFTIDNVVWMYDNSLVHMFGNLGIYWKIRSLMYIKKCFCSNRMMSGSSSNVWTIYMQTQIKRHKIILFYLNPVSMPDKCVSCASFGTCTIGYPTLLYVLPILSSLLVSFISLSGSSHTSVMGKSSTSVSWR